MAAALNEQLEDVILDAIANYVEEHILVGVKRGDIWNRAAANLLAIGVLQAIQAGSNDPIQAALAITTSSTSEELVKRYNYHPDDLKLVSSSKAMFAMMGIGQ